MCFNTSVLCSFTMNTKTNNEMLIKATAYALILTIPIVMLMYYV